MIKLKDIQQAQKNVYPLAKKTPLVEVPELSQFGSGELYFKMEFVQQTGAFKLRGAANKLKSLSNDEKSKGVIAVSTGNHGKAVAYVAKKCQIPATICISKQVPGNKVRALKNSGANLEIVGNSYDEAYDHALHLIKEQGTTLVHPFDDPYIIAGQGTIGLELYEEMADIDTVVVPLSGGGLIAGIACALKELNPKIRVIGVSMENGAAMYASLQANKPVQVEEIDTLADSLKGGIGLDNQYTFSLVNHFVDDVILVSEEEIKEALQYLFYEQHIFVEGGAVVGVAAFISGKIPNLKGKCVFLLSGRNGPYETILNKEEIDVVIN